MGTFLCNECGKSFTEEAHMKVHSGDNQLNAANVSMHPLMQVL